ncbi:MAG TPA: BON domain-containing protein [Bryobacteraceae bacterium]|nr:BON domain-containing protein [Bryobacteraceae bacterium]
MRAIRAIPVIVWVACGLAGANGAADAQTTSKSTASAATRATSKAPARRPLAAKSDAQIEAAIKAKLAKSPKLSVEHLQVRVQGGVATFEGKTDVVQHKGTATRMAKSAGAVAVNNHIQVSEAAKEKAAGNLQTGRRRVQIKRGDPRSETSTAKGQTR